MEPLVIFSMPNTLIIGINVSNQSLAIRFTGQDSNKYSKFFRVFFISMNNVLHQFHNFLKHNFTTNFALDFLLTTYKCACKFY